MPGEKFHRCVRKVRAKGGVKDPHAVCAAALKLGIGIPPKKKKKKKK